MSRARRLRRHGQADGEGYGGEREKRAGEKDCAKPRLAAEPSQQRQEPAERYVEIGCVDADGEAARVRRRTPHRFDAKPGEDERVSEANQDGAEQAPSCRRRGPQDCEARGFERGESRGDPRSALAVGQMAEQQACADEGERERGIGQPRGAPIPLDEIEYGKCGHAAEADAAEGQRQPRHEH